MTLSDGRVFTGRTIIIATGAQYCKRQIPDVDRFNGTVVFSAATAVEAQRCSQSAARPDRRGGNSAGAGRPVSRANTGHCRLLIRAADLRNSMSPYLVDQVTDHLDIELITQTEIVALHGADSLAAATIVSGERVRVDTCGVFVFIGATPRIGWLRD